MRTKCDLQTKEFRYCDMKKVLSVLMVLVLTTMCALAKDESKSTVQRIRVNHKGITPASSWEKLELGVQVGVGFHLGTNSPTDGYTRVFQNALTQQETSEDMVRLGEKVPMMETFGLVARYSFDCHWAIQLQGMRQRIYFRDVVGSFDAQYGGKLENVPYPSGTYYYNAMWDLDFTAEYNILPYGLAVHRPSGVKGAQMRIYPATPYVLFGVGVALSNKEVPARQSDEGSMFPMIRPADGNLAANVYIPLGVGVKWRIDYNWQLKAACQYHLGFGHDPSGATKGAIAYENLASGAWHNVVLNIGVVYNFGKHKRMLVDY